MNHFLKGISYSYNRNIGWQDRTIRSIAAAGALIGAIYFYETNFTATIILGVFVAAQVFTVSTAKCIVCYFTGQCTITKSEKQSLDSKGILHG